MKQAATGQVHERITAIADVGYPGYVVRGDEKILMIDSGVNRLGPRYRASLRELGDAGRLDYLLLTHSHYDHVGSAGYLKRHLPGLQIGAHERVAGLVQKPSALELMNRLSVTHHELQEYNPDGEDLTLHPFVVDVLLKQGDEIDLGGLTCTVYEVPGHTRDSLAYYFPQIGALFPGDACGVLRTGPGMPVQVEFLASYQDYVTSLELMVALAPEIVCLAHNWVLTPDDAAEFLAYSLAETHRYREMLEGYLDAANDDIEQALREMVSNEYGSKSGLPKPNPAHLTNLAAQFRHIAEVRGPAGVPLTPRD
jgi:glyoxylase-like metal-dependent hydrolase (beta-lactamase superfamily II)